MTNYLFLDIDGVLNACGALLDDVRMHQAWPDYELVNGERFGETVSPALVAGLNQIITRHNVTVVWLTTWEREAPAFGHNIGLHGAQDWPWLPTNDDHGEWGKHSSIRKYLHQHYQEGDRFAWFDDDLATEHDAALWAARQGILAIPSAPRRGITSAHLHLLAQHYEVARG